MKRRSSAPDDTSLQCFRRYIYSYDTGAVDATRVLSKECFHWWLQNRKSSPRKPEESYRRVLVSHLRGTSGRKPFTAEEEEAILALVRKKHVWPCFAKNEHTKVGLQGFKGKGFHETQQRASTSDLTNFNASLRRTPSMMSASSAGLSNHSRLSSYEVFLRFAAPDRFGCSRIVTKECFDKWVETRKKAVKNPEQSFRKALVAHICGRDGRRPFPAELEPLVLEEVRRHKRWPCFAHSSLKNIRNIGSKGFRDLGFHETRTKALTTSEPAGRREDPFPLENEKQSNETDYSDLFIFLEDDASLPMNASTSDRSSQNAKRHKTNIPTIDDVPKDVSPLEENPEDFLSLLPFEQFN